MKEILDSFCIPILFVSGWQNQYHGQIAKTISNIPNIKSFGIKIKTHTIYGDISENEVWQKI